MALDEQILMQIFFVDAIIGIISEGVRKSHPTWGCPQEWRMGVDAKKRVFLLGIIDKWMQP